MGRRSILENGQTSLRGDMMLDTDILPKIAQKAIKQPKIALRKLRQSKLDRPHAELAIQSYDMNRRRSGEEAARETMLAYLR